MKRMRQLVYQKTDKGKACRKRWYDKHHDERIAAAKKYRDDNRLQRNANKREYYRKNRDRLLVYNRARHREKHLRLRYGITLERFNQLLSIQKHRCAICLEPFQGNPVIDHCHVGGHVRALLCAPCNSAIGFLRHNHKIALAAAHYLSKEVLFNAV